MVRSWKTTLAGVLALATTVGNAILAASNGQPVDFASVFAAVIAAAGLIFAKDANVSGPAK